jgi:hypothetical protein
MTSDHAEDGTALSLPDWANARNFAILPARVGLLPKRVMANSSGMPKYRNAATTIRQQKGCAMIRCVRLWTGEDGDSHFEEGSIDLSKGERGDILSEVVAGASLSFQETSSGGSYEWHRDPVPRFVITLSGTLEFETRGGERFTIRPGDILLAQDNTGSGHRWKLIGDEPWRRAYVVFPTGAALQYKANSPKR